MFHSLKLRKRLSAVITLVSMMLHIFSPLIGALSLPTIAHAQDDSLNLSFNQSTHTLSLGSSLPYELYYQTGETTEAVKGTSNIIFLGSASSADSVAHNLVRGIIKTTDQTHYFVNINNDIETVVLSNTATTGLSSAEESWLNDPSTYGDLQTGVSYRAHFDSDLSLVFSSLPDNPGTITFSELTLTPDQMEASGSLSSQAYEITSSMEDGTFAYTLSLPNPGTQENVGIKYSEDGESFTQVSEVVSNPDQVTATNLDHFTIFVVVRPADLATPIVDVFADNSAWFFYNDETDTIDNSLGSFVVGPDTAPLGNGSVQISVTGTQRRNLATYQFAGTKLDDISTLKFSTYNSSSGNAGSVNRSGYLNFNVDFNGTDTWQSRLVFVPSTNGTVLQDTWQSWDALQGGSAKWVYSGSNWPVTGQPGTTTKTWSQILTDYPLARIRVSDSWLGIRVGEPYSDGYTENIDSFEFGTTTDGITQFNFDPTPATPPCIGTSSFDSASLGSVNGQDGWTITGPYDQAVVENIYGYESFGCKSLRISDSITSNSFGDQLFAPPTVNGAGETVATAGTYTLGTRQNHFETQFDLASVKSTHQPGLHVSISPDRGDGSRMSYILVEDTTTGLDVLFYDVQGTSNPASFVPTQIATGLDRNIPHTFKISMDFLEGPSNDIVKVWIDGTLVHTGTSWENYYRYDSEASAEQSPRIVKTLLFRQSGVSSPANSGKGFLIDNFSGTSSITTPSVPTATLTANSLNVPSNGYTNSENFTYNLTSSPYVTHYQLKYWNDIPGSVFKIGSPWNPTNLNSYSSSLGVYNDHFTQGEGIHYFSFSACNGADNCSSYSSPYVVTYDHTAPSVPVLTWPIGGIFTNDNTPLMQWDNSSDVFGVAGYLYRVYYNCTNPSVFSTCTQVYPSTVGLWLTASQYQAGTTTDGVYYWQVRAQDNAGNQSVWSDVENVTIDTIAPIAPVLTSPADNAYVKGNPTQTWSASPGTDHYVYESYADIGLTTPIYTTTLSGTSRTVGGNQTISFWWRVKAVDSVGNESPWSQVWKLNVDNTAPTDPTDVASNTHTPSISNSNNVIGMAWSLAGALPGATDAISGVEGYSYSFTTSALDLPDDIKDLDETATGVVSPTLADGTWYFHLRTLDKAGHWTSTVHTGPYIVDTSTPSQSTSSSSSSGGSVLGSSTSTTCTDSKPAAPTLLVAQALSNSVLLTWSEGSGPLTYYLVAYGTSPGTPLYGNPNIGGPGTTSYLVEGLSGGTTYYFQVRSGNGCATGDFSGQLQATPTGGFIAEPATGFEEEVLGVDTEEESDSNTEEIVDTELVKQGGVLGESDLASGFFWWYLLIPALLLGLLLFWKRRKTQDH